MAEGIETHEVQPLSENQKLIESAQTYDELVDILVKNQITIQGSIKEYSTQELVDIVRGVATHDIDIVSATRTDGFRNRLLDLRE